jgi:hypothetical protein
MKKKITIEFTHLDGSIEEITFETDKSYEWTVEQFSRNRAISSHRLINESNVSGKQMLFG